MHHSFMEGLVSELVSHGLDIAPQFIPRILEFFKKPRTREEFENEILPNVSFRDGSDVTVEGILNIFTNAGFEIVDSKLTISGVTNIIATDSPAELNIVNTKKPKKGRVIGSVSFTNKGIVIDSTDD